MRGVRLLPLALAAMLALAGTASPALAGVFDDDEARKAILDLRTKVKDVDESSRKRDADAATAQQQFAEQMQKSLFDLNNQNEQLRAEIARLRGSNEQLARDVAELQRRQKDIAQGVDDRLRKVEPQKVSVDGIDFTAEPDETRSYDDALAQFKAGDFDRAATMLSAFMKRYPTSGYTDSARYWYGNALYGKRAYKDAILTFKAFVAGAPEHARAPEALLAVANCQIETKDLKTAKKTLDELIRTYPRSEAALAAKERLQGLK